MFNWPLYFYLPINLFKNYLLCLMILVRRRHNFSEKSNNKRRRYDDVNTSHFRAQRRNLSVMAQFFFPEMVLFYFTALHQFSRFRSKINCIFLPKTRAFYTSSTFLSTPITSRIILQFNTSLAYKIYIHLNLVGK